MVEIDVTISREFVVQSDYETVWTLLADTQATLKHYPSMDKLVALGDDRWRWELEPKGIKGISHQVIYSVHYSYDRDAGIISWTPLKDAASDNAHISGRFKIEGRGDETSVNLSTDGSLKIPAPRILAGAVRPILEREFNQQIERFMASLKNALE